jgi:hypothetical protein
MYVAGTEYEGREVYPGHFVHRDDLRKLLAMGYVELKAWMLGGDKREIVIPHTVEGVVNGAKKTLYPNNNWGGPGMGSYPKGVQKDSDGKYKVAVGPKIIDPNYPDSGRIWADDFENFSKTIYIFLEHKSTENVKVIECVVADYKAHSYNKYRDGHPYDTGDTAAFEVENGLIQTGIAYPRSWNATQKFACSLEHMDGQHVIEFCGHAVDFAVKDYRLLKVVTENK